MSFTEKSSWVMLVILTGLGIIYANIVIGTSLALGETAPPNIVLISSVTLTLVILAIISHIFVAALDIEGVDSDGDERDKQISRRAGNIAGYVLGFGVFGGLWHYFTHADGNMLFHIVVASLIISQIMADIMSIFFYRRSA